jgi:phospholipid transport system transporter-binding protein
VSENGVSARHDGVVEVSGRMTFQTVPEFVARGAKFVNGGGVSLTIDMDKVTLVDSAGVALMLEWLAQARAAKRELRFINLHEQLRHLISVSGLDKAFGLN